MTFHLLKPDDNLRSPRANRERRKLRVKFREAFRGIKLGVRGHSSFFVHNFCAAAVIIAAAVAQCDVVEWIALIGCIGAVFAAELFNSAIESLFHGLDVATKQRLKGVLDISAGAVLVVCTTAVIIGGIIFGSRIWELVARLVGVAG